MANEEENSSDCDTSEGRSYASAADVFENEVVHREIFKYLSLSDLLSLSLVNSSLCQRTRRFLRKNRTCNINVPQNSRPCQALLILENQLEQMEELPFTGLNIHLNICKNHHDPCHNVDEEFPNILNRLTLKRIRVNYIFKQPIICWKTVELVAKLLEKNAMILEELDVRIPECFGEERDIIQYLHGSNVYPRVQTVSSHCYLLEQDLEALIPLVVACPNVKQISFADERLIPSEVYPLVNKVHLSEEHWPEIEIFRSFIQQKSSVQLIKSCNMSFQAWESPNNYELVMEHLMQTAQNSLQTLVMHGEEFFRWSNFGIPTMKNLQNVQIMQPLNKSPFLKDFCHLCTLLPSLQVVHLKHQSWDVLDDDECIENFDEIKPNLSAYVFRLEDFRMEMDTLMESFTKLFPNLKELHVFDCDSTVLNWIFEWSQLECLVLVREHSHWTDNFDHLMLGVTCEELEEMKSGRVIVPFRPSLLSLRSLRRLYVIGGPIKTDDDAFLSPWAMSVITKWMPNLAVRILRGFKESVLEHLLPFDNFSQHIVYPSCPYDITQLFCS